LDYIFEKKWQDTLRRVSTDYGDELDLQAVLFLIGVQELGLGYRKFKKDEKVDLMHIAICTLLSPYGYYSFDYRDEEGWPHFERLHNLPPLEAAQQEILIKKAIITYFGEDE